MLDDAYQAESANAEPPDDEPEDPSQYERDQPERIGRAPREVQQPVFEDPSGVIPQQADGTYSRLTPQQVDERQMMGRLPEHARQHLAVQQLALSQAEKMNLQRLQNGMGTVDKMLARGQIDQDQADEAKAKILSIKGPLERRAAQAVAQKHELESKALMDQQAKMAAIEAMNESMRLGNVDKLPLMTDPETGKQHRMLINPHTGEWYSPLLKVKEAEARIRALEAKEKGDAEDKKQEKITTHLEKREKEWVGMYDKAVKTVDQKIADKREAEAEANLDAKTKGTGVREHSDFNRDKMIADELKARGHEGTIEEHRAAERVKLGLKPQAEVNPVNPPNVPGDSRGGPASAIPPSAAPLSPFKVDEKTGGDPSSMVASGGDALHPAQAKAIDDLDAVYKYLDTKNFPNEATKKAHLQDVRDMAAALAKYGSADNMRDADPALYERFVKQKQYWKSLREHEGKSTAAVSDKDRRPISLESKPKEKPDWKSTMRLD